MFTDELDLTYKYELMQPSELWRRGVVLPLDDSARSDMESWAITERTSVEFVPLDDLFGELCDLGVFEDLNAACSTLIGDYEEDWLPASKARAALSVVTDAARRSQTEAARGILAPATVGSRNPSSAATTLAREGCLGRG